MKILVASDTHGYYSPISDYILSHDDIDLLIHAGDGVEDVKSVGFETSVNYRVVRGNNDFEPGINFDEIIEIPNHKIFLTHGHNYQVDFTYDKLIEKAKSIGADIAIFGHTHRYYKGYHDGVLLLNPGSVSLSRYNNPGFMIMNLDGNDIELERIKLK